ncbi:BgTH12-07310 [Blumeria graminis f. sp. triticale]|uniref:BgTH12-07310 n=1 Tax=Blumeria graminis f. sp. triticale TaxID=1689686 RepID=A0A9W4DQZ0_BLUGR|nr:BgTH12-07310 [Blumeria graminis f. sp. triticale]
MKVCFVVIRQLLEPNILNKVVYHLVLLSGWPPLAIESNYVSEGVNIGHDYKRVENLMRMNYLVTEERRSPAINLCVKEGISPHPRNGLGLKFKNSNKKIESFNKRGGMALASGVIKRNLCTRDDILNYIRLSLATAVRRDQLHESSSTMNLKILMDIPVALIDLSSSNVGYEFQGFILIFNKDRQMQAFKINKLNLDSEERTCQPMATKVDEARIISLAFQSWRDLNIQGLKTKCMVTFDVPFTTTTSEFEFTSQKATTNFIAAEAIKEEIP